MPRKRRNDLVIFGPARGKHATDMQWRPAISMSCPALVQPRGQSFAYQHVAANYPPATRLTFHQGCVLRTPVMKSSVPNLSRFAKVCSEQGDIVRRLTAETVTGSMGANPVMLLCQKIPLIFGSSASLRKAPSLGGLRLTPAISHVEGIFLGSDDEIGADRFVVRD